MLLWGGGRFAKEFLLYAHENDEKMAGPLFSSNFIGNFLVCLLKVFVLNFLVSTNQQLSQPKTAHIRTCIYSKVKYDVMKDLRG